MTHYKVMKDSMQLGAIVYKPAMNGWYFINKLPHGGNSRKGHATPEAAILPRIKRIMTHLVEVND